MKCFHPRYIHSLPYVPSRLRTQPCMCRGRGLMRCFPRTQVTADRHARTHTQTHTHTCCWGWTCIIGGWSRLSGGTVGGGTGMEMGMGCVCRLPAKWGWPGTSGCSLLSRSRSRSLSLSLSLCLRCLWSFSFVPVPVLSLYDGDWLCDRTRHVWDD